MSFTVARRKGEGRGINGGAIHDYLVHHDEEAVAIQEGIADLDAGRVRANGGVLCRIAGALQGPTVFRT
ncbi:MAG: hypothetical protein OHK0029_25840 [Armatimonadaceae bacterium]